MTFEVVCAKLLGKLILSMPSPLRDRSLRVIGNHYGGIPPELILEGFYPVPFLLEQPTEQFDIIYREVEDVVEEVLPMGIRRERVGSASIKGMPGTGDVDIMVTVEKLPLPKDTVQSIRDLGFFYLGNSPHAGKKGVWFVKPKNHTIPGETGDVEGCAVLHVVIDASGVLERMVRFREYLLAEPAAFQKYADVKVRLADAEKREMVVYKLEKKAVVLELVKESLEWEERTRGEHISQ